MTMQRYSTRHHTSLVIPAPTFAASLQAETAKEEARVADTNRSPGAKAFSVLQSALGMVGSNTGVGAGMAEEFPSESEHVRPARSRSSAVVVGNSRNPSHDSPEERDLKVGGEAFSGGAGAGTAAVAVAASGAATLAVSHSCQGLVAAGPSKTAERQTGYFVLFEGGAGSGKTRVAREIVQLARLMKIPVCWASGDVGNRAPLRIFSEIVAALTVQMREAQDSQQASSARQSSARCLIRLYSLFTVLSQLRRSAVNGCNVTRSPFCLVLVPLGLSLSQSRCKGRTQSGYAPTASSRP